MQAEARVHALRLGVLALGCACGIVCRQITLRHRAYLRAALARLTSAQDTAARGRLAAAERSCGGDGSGGCGGGDVGGGGAAPTRSPCYTPPSPHQITLLADASTTERVLNCWLRAMASGFLPPLIGLDAEWVRNRPPSLLQLATDRRCILVRLCAFEGLPHTQLPPSLLHLLGSDRIIKAGVGVTDDLARISALLGVPTAGALELAPIAAAVGHASGGLSHLAREILAGFELKKPAAVRCGDWEAKHLSGAQVAYAATDAHVGYAIMHQLHRESRSTLPLDAWCRQCAALEQGGGGVVARPRSKRGAAQVLTVKPSPVPSEKKKRSDEHDHRAADRRAQPRVLTRARPLYDGWLMLSPEGKTMCRLKESRARW